MENIASEKPPLEADCPQHRTKQTVPNADTGWTKQFPGQALIQPCLGQGAFSHHSFLMFKQASPQEPLEDPLTKPPLELLKDPHHKH